MKKIAICTAVAAICAAPMSAMAGPDFYGNLRVALTSADPDTAAGSTLAMQDNVSRLGFKAMSEGDGIKAFVHLQSSLSTNGTPGGGPAIGERFYFAGLKGDFGTVSYGLMTAAYKLPGFKMDPFYDSSKISAAGGIGHGGATYGLSGATNGFTANALQYTSKAMGKVTVNAGLYIDDGNNDDHDIGFGASYKDGGINAGIQVVSTGDAPAVGSGVANIADDGTAVRLHGGYKAGNMSVSASFEQIDMSATTDATYIYVVGKFNISDKTTAAVSFGTVDSDTGSGAPDGTGINAGIFQTIAPKTQVFAQFSQASLDGVGATDPSVISVGVRHNF